MARTGYRQSTIATTAHCPNANSQTIHNNIATGTDNPSIAWNGSYYCCALKHTATGTQAGDKIYTSPDGLTWTWTSSMSTLDGDDVQTAENQSVLGIHVDGNGDFVIPAVHGATGTALNPLYKIGTKVINGTSLAVTDNAAISSSLGASSNGSGVHARSCLDSSDNVWLAHAAGVIRLDGATAAGEGWTWAEIYTDAGGELSGGIDYNHGYANLNIVPLADGEVLASVKSWFDGTTRPAHTFRWDGTNWGNERLWSTNVNTATQFAGVGDTTNDVAYMTYMIEGTTDITLSKWDGSFSDITTTLAADLGYHATTNNPRLPKLALKPDDGTLILGLNIEKSGDALTNRAFHIWRSPNEGTNWDFVGAVNWYQSVNYTPDLDSFKHGHLAEYYNTDDNIYTMVANRYGWFFRDFGDKKQYVHKTDNSYNDVLRRGSGRRHTCIEAGKVWFVHETGQNIVLLDSVDGENWTSTTVKTSGSNPTLCLSDGIIYIIYQDILDSNIVKGKAVTAATTAMGAEITIPTPGEFDTGLSIARSEAGKFWVAIGSNYALGAGNAGRVWSNTSWDDAWTVHDFMAGSRRLGKPELVILANEDVVVADIRAGLGLMYFHHYDHGTTTWTESEDTTSYAVAGRVGYPGISVVADSNDIVHVVSQDTVSVKYHKRAADGTWTTDTNITADFATGIADVVNPLITVDLATDNLRVYGVNNKSTTMSRAVTWTTSTDSGITWTKSEELHDLGMLTTAGTILNYGILHVPYHETEPYVIGIAVYETNDATSSGAIIQWFPRHQNYLRGRGYWYDNRKASPVGQYPYNI